MSAQGFKFPTGTHWTQKPENRERVQELARRRGQKGQELARRRGQKGRRIAKRAKRQGQPEPAPQVGATDTQIAYLYGRIRGWVESFAETQHIEAQPLRAELGRMLVNGKGGAV